MLKLSSDEKRNEILNQLTQKGYTSLQRHEIMEIVKPYLGNDELDEITKIIRYTEKKFSEKFGNDEIFVDYDNSMRARTMISGFKKKYKLTLKEYELFISWVIDNSNKILKKKPNIYDISSEKIYRIYESKKEILTTITPTIKKDKKKIFSLI